MKRCPACSHENAQAHMYCERCGTLLSSSAEHAPSEPTYMSSYPEYLPPAQQTATTQGQSYLRAVPPPPPPPPQMYTPPAVSEPGYARDYGYTPPAVSGSGYAYDYGHAPLPAPQEGARKRSVGAAVLSSILYLLGVASFAFGLAGFIFNSSPGTVIGIVFLAACFIALIVLVLLLVSRKYLRLQWWMRILITVGLTIFGILVLFIVAAASPNSTNYTDVGLVFVIYGLLTAVVAFW